MVQCGIDGCFCLVLMMKCYHIIIMGCVACGLYLSVVFFTCCTWILESLGQDLMKWNPWLLLAEFLE